MKKNNKGFFLAETIIMIALVTTVMAFVYPNISKLYETYVDKTKYYDQTQDIYTLRAVYDYLISTSNVINDKTTNGSKSISSLDEGKIDNNDVMIQGLQELYIISYTEHPSAGENYDFTRYLNRMKVKTYDTFSYRLIGVFEGNRYASVKIDDPSPY